MAQGRTVSASFLTDIDTKVLNFCQKISDILRTSISDELKQKDFKEKYSKISKTRDAGLGLGGGKLQRDALTTRGISGLAPFSNRNLRWHPLVAAQNSISFAKTIKRIDIEANTLHFVVDIKGKEIIYPADKAHEMPERYAVLSEHWLPHIDILKNWSHLEWNQNSAIITAYESCNWFEAVEAYAILGVAIVVSLYEVSFDAIYPQIKILLKNQDIDKNIILPSLQFPKDEKNIVACPLCKIKASHNPANLPDREREQRWKPEWTGNKRGEGDDSSMQIMHIEPLTEAQINHNSKNVRFGHRWCNVAMTDHSIEQTVDFMEFIVKAHNRIK